MPDHAYRDSERKNKIDNLDVIQNPGKYQDPAFRAYCSNPNCTAHMRHRISSKGNIFWAAIPSFPHSLGCSYTLPILQNFDPEDYDYKSLSPSDLFRFLANPNEKRPDLRNKGGVRQGNDSRSKKSVGSLRTAYGVMKSVHPGTWLRGTRVLNALIDNRSIWYHVEHNSLLGGWHMGEFRFDKYNSQEHTIDVCVHGMNHSPIRVTLDFQSSKDLFYKTKNAIFEKRKKEHEGVIIAAGHWIQSSTDTSHYTIPIETDRQLIIQYYKNRKN